MTVLRKLLPVVAAVLLVGLPSAALGRDGGSGGGDHQGPADHSGSHGSDSGGGQGGSGGADDGQHEGTDDASGGEAPAGSADDNPTDDDQTGASQDDSLASDDRLTGDKGNPSKHGSSQSGTGKGTTTSRRDGGSRNGKGGTPADKRIRSETYTVRGTVASTNVAAGLVTVRVTNANHGRRGRSLIGASLTFDVSHARLTGISELEGLTAGDRVRVDARLPRPLPDDLTATFVARRLIARTGTRA
jgi:hypothetical protein